MRLREIEGCPTGLRPSGPISRIVMDFWVKEIKQIEAKSGELVRLNPVMFEPLQDFYSKSMWMMSCTLAINSERGPNGTPCQSP